MDTFGELISTARKARGWTLAQLGDRIGCDHARIWRFERDAARPSAAQLEGLVTALELDAGEALRLAAAPTDQGDHREAV